jgi:hypothetical protein
VNEIWANELYTLLFLHDAEFFDFRERVIASMTLAAGLRQPRKLAPFDLKNETDLEIIDKVMVEDTRRWIEPARRSII